MMMALILAAVLHPADVSMGHWEGVMQRGSSTLRVAFDFPGGNPNAALFSSSDIGAIDIPLHNVHLGKRVHWNLIGDESTTIFDGSIAGDSMSGRFQDPVGNGHFLLKRVSRSTEKPYTIEDVTFANAGVTLSGSLRDPRSKGRHPALLFVQGSGPEGRWASAFLADYFTRNGYVTLTYDKRGVGKSSGDWRTATFQDLAADARAGVALLAHRLDVDPSRIGIYGHSQGAAIAPAIAAGNPLVAWIIAADGPVGPMYKQDLFRVDNILSAKYTGTTLVQAKQLFAEFVDVARSGAPASSSQRIMLREHISKAGKKSWLDDLGIPDDRSWIWNWYAKTGDWDNRPYWAMVNVPVLLVFGANDHLVPQQQSIAEVKAILLQHARPRVRVNVISGADHTLHIPPIRPGDWPHRPPDYPDMLVAFP